MFRDRYRLSAPSSGNPKMRGTGFTAESTKAHHGRRKNRSCILSSVINIESVVDGEIDGMEISDLELIG